MMLRADERSRNFFSTEFFANEVGAVRTVCLIFAMHALLVANTILLYDPIVGRISGARRLVI